MHNWYERTAREKEEFLRMRGVFAHNRIKILKKLGSEIFEPNTTVYEHITRSQTLHGRTYVLSELCACLCARIIEIVP